MAGGARRTHEVEIEDRFDLAEQMSRRDPLLEAELVEQRRLFDLARSHHRSASLHHLLVNLSESRQRRIAEGFFNSRNGFVERFNGTVLEEFFRPVMHQKLFTSVEELQAHLDTWLHHYNRERPHLGYRNQGRRPWDTVQLFVSQGG